MDYTVISGEIYFSSEHVMSYDTINVARKFAINNKINNKLRTV